MQAGAVAWFYGGHESDVEFSQFSPVSEPSYLLQTCQLPTSESIDCTELELSEGKYTVILCVNSL